jgi:stage V sporulation protein G
MKPTKITIRKIPQPKGKVLAFVEVEFDELLVVRNLKIVNGKQGLFLAMPNKPSGQNDGKFYDDVYIVDSFKDNTPGQEFKNKLQAAVLKKWEGMSGGAAFADQTEGSVAGGNAAGSGDFAGDDVH